MDVRSLEHWRAKVDKKMRHHLCTIAGHQRRNVLPLVDENEALPQPPEGFENAQQEDRFDTGGQRANVGNPGEFLPIIFGKQNDGDQPIFIEEH